jgi:hypothetical protein
MVCLALRQTRNLRGLCKLSKAEQVASGGDLSCRRMPAPECAMHRTVFGARLLAAVAGSLLVAGAAAQSMKLPGTSRTVYKCTIAGKVVYTDDPCLGAERVDVEPTRGVSKLTGTERVGPDVQREESREAFAEGIGPITGMDAKQLNQAGRRQKLSPDAR